MLCEITKKQSIWIWNKLKDARKYQSKIGEESITDFFILALKKAHKGNNYEVNSFTRPQESKNGADWEIWLTGNSGKWLGLRVQAKVISLDGTEYTYLHYKNKRSGLSQTEKLINDAIKNKAIPLYCLYSYWSKDDSSIEVNSWCSKMTSRSICPFGASILHAEKVKENSDVKLTSIASSLIPLHCLFCHYKNNQAEDLPNRAYNFLRSNILLGDYADSVYLLDLPPKYVYSMLEKRSIQYEDRDLNFSGNKQDDALARVTVIREINHCFKDKK